MKNLLLLIVCLNTFHFAFAQRNQWTWVSGDNSPNMVAVYGTKGVPSLNNKPGGRALSATWIDSNNNLWLFGGTRSTNPFGYLNDLWKFNTSTNEWVWVAGSNTTNSVGIYGNKGVSSTNYIPCSRSHATTWVDASGNFWLFGGEGMISNFSSNTNLNDLWKYNPLTSEWTWMSGDYTPGQPYPSGIYGIKGQPSINNKPGGKYGASGWTGANGSLWLFGGYGVAANTAGYLNDLWKYNILTNEWTWVSGANSAGQPPIYGTRGTPSTSNIPGARTGTVSWIDASGALWLFGGQGANISLNDLWKFNTSTNEWTWVSGDNIPNQPAVYGTKGISSPNNKPGARGNMVMWKDSEGSFWLFGGSSSINQVYNGYNDLWKYNPNANEWTWVSGDNVGNMQGIYGTLNQSSGTNKPGARDELPGWVDNKNNLWFYGGYLFNPAAPPQSSFFGDLWKYSPFPQVSTLPFTVNRFCAGNSLSVAYTVTGPFNSGNVFTAQLSDASGSFTNPVNIGTTISGSAGTINATIPATTPFGTNYRIRVVASDPAVIGNDNGSNIGIFSNPVVTITPTSPASVCLGNSITISAQVSGGVAPYSYHWSNNSTTSSITVTPGSTTIYSLTVSDAGCGIIKDSISIAVVDKEKVSLGPDLFLCANGSKTLKTNGIYNSYTWQDGSTGPTLSIQQPGIYSITATDACNNTSKDTVEIFPAPNPEKFLPADTSVCIYGNITMRPLSSFNTYLWSTAEKEKVITITKPGLYWLEVTDKNNCKGKDTVIVNERKCADGFFMPTAFTPNGDGKNERLKPIVFGNFKNYHFTVFNRWGAKVFETTDVSKGWDGSYKNATTNSSVFIWICTYQLDGLISKIEKGTVLIIK